MLASCLRPLYRPLLAPRSSIFAPRPEHLQVSLRSLSNASTLASESEVSPITTTSSATASLASLTYHIHRTPSQQLPIYHLTKGGGNLRQTRIRKIEGNIDHLRDDLQKALSLDDRHISINRLTGHIIIKGWKRGEVAKFLEEKRF